MDSSSVLAFFSVLRTLVILVRSLVRSFLVKSRFSRISGAYSGMYKLAKLFNVTRTTIYRWIENHSEFCDGVRVFRRCKKGADVLSTTLFHSFGTV